MDNALFRQLEPWIIRTDQDVVPFQDPASPQSRAFKWLSDDYLTRWNIYFPTVTANLERYALAVLYYATDGPSWTRQDLNFLTEMDVCDWNNDIPLYGISPVGIYCEDISSVQNIILDELGLAGTLPWELTLLSQLELLNVIGNELIGSIATEVGCLHELRFLDIGRNDFIGTLPTEIGLLTMLTVLLVNDNHLTGTLPTELGALTWLTWVSLQNNAFIGTMPATLSRWENVGEFLFSGNNLTGSVNDVLCSGGVNWETLQGDCVASNDEIELACPCCTICCDAKGENCQDM